MTRDLGVEPVRAAPADSTVPASPAPIREAIPAPAP